MNSKTLKLFPLFLMTFYCSYAQPKREVSYTPSNVLIQDGIKFHDEGKYKDAINKYKQVNESDTAYALALYEMALSATADSNSAEAIEICKKGLKLKSEYTAEYLVLLGNAYDQNGNFEDAISTYNEGIKLYPYFYRLYFEMGIAYARNNNDTAAARCFKQALHINPFHSRSHYQLGSLAARNDKFSQGILSYLMSLLLQPEGNRAFETLRMIEAINKGEFKPNKEKVVDISDGIRGDHFELTEEIIRSQIALDAQYKSKVKLTYYNLTKPLQAFLEKLTVDKDDNGFWMKTYVPFFTQLWKEDHFEAMMYYICSSINDPKVQSALKSKKSDIDKMIKFSGEFLGAERSNRTMMLNEKLQEVSVIYNDDNSIEGYGLRDKTTKNQIGYWKFFHNNGEIKAEGSLSNSGEYDGIWKIYGRDGKIVKKITYREGKPDGDFFIFHPNGRVDEKGKYENGTKNGLFTGYHYNGEKAFELGFKNGKLDGKMLYYYDNGALQKEYFLKQEVEDGEYKEYYRFGTLKVKCNFVNGKIEGKVTNYFINEKISKEAVYLNGLENGPYKEFYLNGKLALEGVLKNGNREGEWKSYYDNGVLEEIEIYSNGKLNGLEKNYDDDGKLFTEFEFSKGILKSYRYMDKAGKVIHEAKEKKGTLPILMYYPDGKHKSVEGATIDGEIDGKWLVYYKSGMIKSETNYKKGKKHGEEKMFYAHGVVSSVKTYEDGNANGYSCSYFKNGNKKAELWYENDLATGPRKEYYPDGTLSAQKYLLADVVTGIENAYDEKGKNDFNYLMYYDNLEKITGNDTSGNFLFSFDIKDGTQEYIIQTQDKKIRQKGTYVNGNKNGLVKYYYTTDKIRRQENYVNGYRSGNYTLYNIDGKKIKEAFYKYDQLDSLYVTYYENGKQRQRFNYEFNNAQGLGYYFHDNGKVSIALTFKDDLRHGKAFYYSTDSTLKMILNYDYGEIISYSYLGKDGKPVPEIEIINNTGKIVAYYQNGNKSIEFELKNGLYEGSFTHYFPDGKIEATTQYVNDDYNGDVKKYYSNGKLKYHEQWKYDELHGNCKYYKEDGKLEKEVNYLGGYRYGPTIIYDTITGKVKQKLNFYNDQLL